MSNVAQKIFEKHNIETEIKTGLSEDEIFKIISEYDALIVRSATKVTKNIITAGKKLKVIGRAGAGVDNIDVVSAKEKRKIGKNEPTKPETTIHFHCETFRLMIFLKPARIKNKAAKITLKAPT